MQDLPSAFQPRTPIPNPTTRTRSAIASLLSLARIPRLHRFWNRCRAIFRVAGQMRCNCAGRNVAGDDGVESHRDGLFQRLLQRLLVGHALWCERYASCGCC